MVVWTQCWVDRSQTFKKESLDAVTTKIDPEADDVDGTLAEISKNFMAVIWSRWPRSLCKGVNKQRRRLDIQAYLYKPASATTSQMIKSVSCEPEASREPSWSKARDVTAFLCPLKVVITEPEEALHKRTDPSEYPTAKVSGFGERRMQVTSAQCPLSCHIATLVEC